MSRACRVADDADELVQFAVRGRKEGVDDAQVSEYVDRALAAAQRASEQLEVIISLLPPSGTAAGAAVPVAREVTPLPRTMPVAVSCGAPAQTLAESGARRSLSVSLVCPPSDELVAPP